MQNSWINCNRSSDLMEMKLYNAIDRLDQFKLHAYLAIVLINFAFLIQIKNISFSRNGFYKFLESESLVKYFNGLGSDTDKRSNFWFSCYTWCTGEIRSKIFFSYQNLKSAHDVTLFWSFISSKVSTFYSRHCQDAKIVFLSGIERNDK